jgi:hypothetical protein
VNLKFVFYLPYINLQEISDLINKEKEHIIFLSKFVVAKEKKYDHLLDYKSNSGETVFYFNSPEIKTRFIEIDVNSDYFNKSDINIVNESTLLSSLRNCLTENSNFLDLLEREVERYLEYATLRIKYNDQYSIFCIKRILYYISKAVELQIYKLNKVNK